MKKKYPIFYLFDIPVEVILYAIVVELGAKLDNFIFGGYRAEGVAGFEFPYLTVIIFVIATVLLAAAIIASIVNFVRQTIKKRKKRQAAKEATAISQGQE